MVSSQYPQKPVIVIWADRYKRNTSTFTYPSYFMYIKFIEISRPWLPIQKMNTSFFRVPISLLCFQVQRVWKWLTKNCYLFLSFSLTWLSWDRDHIYLYKNLPFSSECIFYFNSILFYHLNFMIMLNDFDDDRDTCYITLHTISSSYHTSKSCSRRKVHTNLRAF